MKQLDLAVIGNCNVAGIIDAHGRHVWFCFPRLDGEPMFSALVDGADPEQGFMDLILANQVRAEQRYLHNTAVLETVLTDKAGAGVRITDLAPRFKRFGRVFRPPMLLRRIEPFGGHPRIKIRIRPRFGYGADTPHRRTGSNHLRYVASEMAVRVTTDLAVSYLAEEVEFTLDRPGHLLIGPDETMAEAPHTVARDFVEETVAYWQDWTRYLSVPFEWQSAVIRAAITLKLCSFEETGGIVAALTTSIPEAANSGRNWDYRFCWLRDAFFTVLALNKLGATKTMEEYVRYLMNAVLYEEGESATPVYPIVPGTPMAEWSATHLRGFRGMGPVRVGNAAVDQVQNDIYGSVVLAANQMFYDQRLPQPAGIELYRQLERVGKKAIETCFEPDAGLWEYRGRMKVHTFSSAMCWAAVNGLRRVAKRLGLEEERQRWAVAGDHMRATILKHAWRPDRNSFVASLDGDGLDASLLLLPEIGIIAPTDERFLATLAAIEGGLLHDGLVYRYDTEDDFGLPETAFLVCTFWYIDALAAAGMREKARGLFERVLALRNHVGLLSEDVDPRSGELWGNFPQTYSLVGMIVSAMRLSRSWEDGLWHV
ncbi:MAG: glycoside hydrolase family 15 protein [Alphaproteobacteria bacterium]|nr:glycoside hydrolase family 15 protein [Alphaproteobacteria bacterium]